MTRRGDRIKAGACGADVDRRAGNARRAGDIRHRDRGPQRGARDARLGVGLGDAADCGRKVEIVVERPLDEFDQLPRAEFCGETASAGDWRLRLRFRLFEARGRRGGEIGLVPLEIAAGERRRERRGGRQRWSKRARQSGRGQVADVSGGTAGTAASVPFLKRRRRRGEGLSLVSAARFRSSEDLTSSELRVSERRRGGARWPSTRESCEV